MKPIGGAANISGITRGHSKTSNCYSLSSIPGSVGSDAGGYWDSISGIGGYETENCIMLGERLMMTNEHHLSNVVRIAGGTLHNNYAWEFVDNNDVEDDEIIWKDEKGLDNKEGQDVSKSEFWGASTKDTFWANPNKLGWNFDNIWEFRTGYDLPQLKGMPSISNPDYIY